MLTFFKCLVEFPCEGFWSCTFVFWEFFFFFFLNHCNWFYLSSWLSLRRFFVFRDLSIFSRLSSCWQIIVHTSLLWFYFCDIGCNFSFLILFGTSYLLMSLNKAVLSVLSFQRTGSSLLIFLVSISYISALIFIIFSLVLTSGFIFLLWCIVGEIGALPLWEKPLSFPPLQLFTCEYCVTFHLSCWLTNYTVVGTALSALPSNLPVGLPAIGPGVSPVFSPGHLCESTEVRSQDCSSRVPGPSVVASYGGSSDSDLAQSLCERAHKAHSGWN